MKAPKTVSGAASVSVVIPCFRCVRTLERAVASVAAQTVLPQEVILVDDGSGDETRSLMNQLRWRYTLGWIRLVLLPTNQGAASARNAGWAQAQGNYVAFLDADDAWHPRKIELQYGYMVSAANVAISGHGHKQVKNLAEVEEIGEFQFHKVSPLHVLLKNPFVTPSFMVRRDLPLRFLASRRHMEDQYFLMQVSSAGFHISKAPVPLAYIFKPIFGVSGLSDDLWEMQLGELENYSLLGRAGSISRVAVVVLLAYSWIKFSRRWMIVWIRKKYKK